MTEYTCKYFTQLHAVGFTNSNLLKLRTDIWPWVVLQVYDSEAEAGGWHVQHRATSRPAYADLWDAA